MRRVPILFTLALLSCLAVSAPAAIIYNQWDGSAGTSNWNTATNWALDYVPFSDNGTNRIKAGFKTATGPVLGVETQNAEAWQGIIGGADGLGVLTVSGGRLTTGDYIIMGNAATETGTLNMNSGNITTTGHFYVGFNGPGTVYMESGTINVGNIFGIAEKAVATSVGRVYLHGGTITATNFQMENSGAIATGLLEIANNGKLIVNGNVVSKVNGYIGNSLITGVGGAVQVVYDSGTNKTSVFVPEPVTIILLGLGSLGLIRRRQ
jgi:hypothetical protein